MAPALAVRNYLEGATLGACILGLWINLINLRRECDLCSDDGIVKFGTNLQSLCVKHVFSIWFDGDDVFNHGNHVNFVINI